MSGTSLNEDYQTLGIPDAGSALCAEAQDQRHQAATLRRCERYIDAAHSERDDRAGTGSGGLLPTVALANLISTRVVPLLMGSRNYPSPLFCRASFGKTASHPRIKPEGKLFS